MAVICTICARKGSKGIKNKALRKIHNVPLISYTIKQALSAKIFSHVVVSTDSREIQRVALKQWSKFMVYTSKKTCK